MLNTAKVAREAGFDVKTASKCAKMSLDRKRNDKNHIYVGSRVENTIHRYFSWITDLQDCGTIFGTLNFIRKIEKYNPDLIHLHDIVGWYLNIDILFTYLKWKKRPVIWTFHDCWAFTGRCIYFDFVKCDRWKIGCGECPQLSYMPGTWYVDHSAWNFRRKKRLFLNIDNLNIVTPSQWLADLTKESFFKTCPVHVINNGIDLNIFKPTKGEIFNRFKALNKKIVLGVAAVWSPRKGKETLIKLARELGDDYLILLVGASEYEVPTDTTNIMAYPRTHNPEELAELYTVANVFANPTLEDNFPTVNLEALACGTPIVTYNTGGSPECVDQYTGRVIPQESFVEFKEAILEVISHGKERFFEACITKSKEYNMWCKLNEYVDLYKNILQ